MSVDTSMVPLKKPLNRMERRTLDAIASGIVHPKDIADHIYADFEDPPLTAERCIYSFVTYIRKKLKEPARILYSRRNGRVRGYLLVGVPGIGVDLGRYENWRQLEFLDFCPSPQEEKIARLLADQRWHTVDSISASLYGWGMTEHHKNTKRIIYVLMSKLRKSLKEDWSIINDFRSRYKLTRRKSDG